uniref:Putative ovule protein n=1 Tax=Solanum chacoense TaxID=4108 RepID=A0A0V0HEK7_SOLCH
MNLPHTCLMSLMMTISSWSCGENVHEDSGDSYKLSCGPPYYSNRSSVWVCWGKSISSDERKIMYISYSKGYNALCFLFRCTYVMFSYRHAIGNKFGEKGGVVYLLKNIP